MEEGMDVKGRAAVCEIGYLVFEGERVMVST